MQTIVYNHNSNKVILYKGLTRNGKVLAVFDNIVNHIVKNGVHIFYSKNEPVLMASVSLTNLIFEKNERKTTN